MPEKPNYYSVIPANVRYDKKLKATEKLLYGEITALCNKTGYCWASNSYFAKLYDVTKQTVSGWINTLEQRGYIFIEIDKKKGNQRLIGIKKNLNTPIQKNLNTPIKENPKHNNTSNNITSINNNIVPKDEIQKIYDALPDYWTDIFKDYIDIYRTKNKTRKITTGKHYKLLSELYYIFQSLKFKFNGREYELTEDIFEYGLEQIIKKGIDSLNYAKQVWISQLKKNKQVGNGQRPPEKMSDEKLEEYYKKKGYR